MTIELILISVVILLFSIIIHELAHGYAALYLGDPTARLAGRLTLNPIKHLDPIGSILVPGLLLLSPSPFVFGWAKPVPYNPFNLKNQRWGEAFVAAAGPLTNLGIALLFGLLIRFSDLLALPPAFIEIGSFIVFINLLLGIFNLIPFPAFDGSKVLRSVLPFPMAQAFNRFEMMAAAYGPVVFFVGVVVFLFILWPFFIGLLSFLFSLITGITFF
ncbi:MAG: site-2 protease family protein [Candidatus Paceibacterota bacterium]